MLQRRAVETASQNENIAGKEQVREEARQWVYKSPPVDMRKEHSRMEHSRKEQLREGATYLVK